MDYQISPKSQNFNIPNPHNFLIAENGDLFLDIVQQTLGELINYHQEYGKTATILMAEPDPVIFLATFWAGIMANCSLILANPNWSIGEWEQVFNRIGQTDLQFGKIPKIANIDHVNNPVNMRRSPFPDGSILIPTGGTSGTIKFAVHTWETLTASAIGFQQYFDQSQINSFCILPLFHVSGLMQFVRSLITGGQLVIWSGKNLENRDYPQLDISDFFISLVPTQLHRLLHHPQTANWLSKFTTVLLGGSPPWLELLNQARRHQIRLSPTYGMTETASGVVTLKPDDFLAGNNSSGRVLPHAKVMIVDPQGQPVKSPEIGLIKIQANSLSWGHDTQINQPRLTQLITDDLGYFDECGYLTLVGRQGDKIITGGENVFPVEVEAAILATGMVADVCVVGIGDRHWGEVVTAVYVPHDPPVSIQILANSLGDRLSRYKHPKNWIAVDTLPRNDRGKINRQLVIQQIQN
ncbi:MULTISPECIES: 2-succinylbenzoate--CoA ligase [Limnospira]|uniref:O-succinylbenzoic acid--CoA ligase n=1 Tax=Limnospira indica PCC 8005 TaxID=376219 RepID=A0A9P1KG22_9CYAN|nr:2-succinylbenzoate--CoA ligase [Limnospira indica]CDM95600.1 O-succinylbenzoic acid--CoA ligase [Limnospira indica PCC 8005]